MLALEVLVAAAILVGVAFVITRGVSGLEDEPPAVPDPGLPADRPLRSDDIDRLRFRVVSGFWGGLRGYRFTDVDAVMERVEETLRMYETDQRSASPQFAPQRRAATPRRSPQLPPSE